MPLKVRRFCTSFFLVISTFALAAAGQTAAPAQPAVSPNAPTTAEVMRDRISKAKAYIAVRNYSAAIYELENIRHETSDQSVNAVANVLLMNSYIEQGDYKRAQDLLGELYKSYKSNSAIGNMYYSTVAAQVLKGARNQVDRYRALGLVVSDRNLPLEAVNDIERMRELVEEVITQSKEMIGDKAKGAAAMALLEEATNSRSLLARDDYDARRWRDEAADSREQLASSRSVVVNAVDMAATPQPSGKPQPAASMTPATSTVAANVEKTSQPVDSAPALKPVPTETKTPIIVGSAPKNGTDQARKPDATSSAPKRDRVIAEETAKTDTVSTTDTAKAEPAPSAEAAPAETGPVKVGSLVAYALKQHAPIYPPAARSMRATGTVRVEVTVNEEGEVAEIENTSGPVLLQGAAKDAVMKWKFKPFMRDGKPVKATGFINFNFTL